MQGYGHVSILKWRWSLDLPLIESWLSFVLTLSLNYESGVSLPSWAHVSLVECGSSSQEGHAFCVLFSSAVALTVAGVGRGGETTPGGRLVHLHSRNPELLSGNPAEQSR